jgi:hypothetical protein
MQSAISKKVTPAAKLSSLRNNMTTDKIDNSQRTAAKVAGGIETSRQSSGWCRLTFSFMIKNRGYL